MTTTPETRPLIRRLLGSDAAIAQLVVITVLIFVAMTAMNPDKFLRYYNFESISYIMPELGILSIAMMIAMLTGGIDLSVVGVANLAAIVAGVYFRIPAVQEAIGAGGAGVVMHTVAAVLIALLVGLAAGVINGLLIARLRIIPILATLGTGQIFAGLALVLTGGPAIVGFPQTWAWIGTGKILGLATPLWVLIVVALLVAVALTRTTLGVSLMLIGTNPRAAIFAGIRSGRMILYSYMLTGVLSAIAGVLLSGRTNSAKADFGASYLLQAVLIAVLGGTNPAGGKGRVLGVLLALIALMLLSSGLQIMRMSNFLIDAVWGGFLVVVIAINYLRSQK
ncbi:ABC transporter permease [Paenirhodobacter populi]|uniref:ABC transporter permease n=1 Tax=Paenirhodobacter populi TaxID=2306993 RepID=A0A443JKE3_9RHOB|nr:ABC transporter permease [Sinirhodobacter populi]RWR10975.1 ABC transporter permease [Sinirhodobacter populi]RWR21049.1 ABC transporter permease [Sinirhodobacter populi]